MKFLSVFFIGLVCGYFGAYGGAENTSKSWRRVVIPLILTTITFIIIRDLWTLTLLTLVGVLSLGYGIPCEDDPKPSHLGKFWYKVFKGNEKPTVIATRLSIGILKGLCLLSIPLLKGNWLHYFWICLGICGVNVLFGAIIKDEGMFKFLGKKLLWEEFYIYSLESMMIISLIL